MKVEPDVFFPAKFVNRPMKIPGGINRLITLKKCQRYISLQFPTVFNKYTSNLHHGQISRKQIFTIACTEL